jgi:tetratricopeptide (TPR) repeat protein
MSDYEKGLQKLREGKYDSALIYFDNALTKTPKDASCLSDKAVTLFHLGRKEEALELLNQAQVLEPANPYRYSSRAFIKDSLGDLQGAIEDYQKAIELDPEDMVAYNNLGMLEEKLGYKEAAKKKFEQADELAKKLGLVFDENGNLLETAPGLAVPNAANGHRKEDIEGKQAVLQEISAIEKVENTNEEILKPSLPDYFNIIKSIFTSKQGFQEFIDFVLRKK